MGNYKVYLFLVSCLVWSRCEGRCREPSNTRRAIGKAFYEIYSNPFFGNFTFFKIPSVRESLDDHLQFEGHNDVGSGNRYYCNNLGTTANSFDILPNVDQFVSVDLGDFERTGCRWNYHVTFDENRIPKYITEAACQCDKCRRGRCRKVYSYIPIVMKKCNVITGEYFYKGIIRETPVACVCVNNQQRVNHSGFIASYE